jgi:hypothetical protein
MGDSDPPQRFRQAEHQRTTCRAPWLPFGSAESEADRGTVSVSLLSLWNEYVARYHYLGYTPMSGSQIRYSVYAGDRLVALLGFGASAWKLADRERFIGWNHEQRQKNLQLVVNNARFLILPWIQSKGLASKILAMAARRLPVDWLARYG